MTRRSANDRPMVEWIVGACACVAVAGLIAFLLLQALTGDTRPPRLSVTVERIERDGPGTVVRIAVVNHGDRAAAGVTVYAADGTAERSVEFDYVAGHAVRRVRLSRRDRHRRPPRRRDRRVRRTVTCLPPPFAQGRARNISGAAGA